ncbi:MAG: hypothetical protein IKI11_05700 [Neisseriaceae bacterium]|nr:hypothetical protein [Neisseriaceae bacterium]
MREISFEEMQLVGGGAEDMCGWKDFGDALAKGAIDGGVGGAVYGSFAPGVGTVLGGITGAIGGMFGSGSVYFYDCAKGVWR